MTTPEIVTRKEIIVVALWAIEILGLYIVAGSVGARQLRQYRAKTLEMRQARLEEVATERSKNLANIELSKGAKPVEVLTGIYVNYIGEFALREAGCTADFDIWFRWTGAGVNPGQTFQVVNGQIASRDKQEEYLSGGKHYERYRVKARIAKSFDTNRFPFAGEPLTIQVEDASHGIESLRYVPDTQDSNISPTAILQQLKISQSLIAVQTHDYRSRRGDPRVPAAGSDVHSRLIFAMLLAPPGAMYHLKLFNALFVSVAIALVAFFIKPIHVDPRFGLGVGAVFAAIGNVIYIGAFLPRADQVTLTDMVNGTGLVTIFLSLVQSTVSLYIFDTKGREKLSRLFDRVSFTVSLPVTYLSVWFCPSPRGDKGPKNGVMEVWNIGKMVRTYSHPPDFAFFGSWREENGYAGEFGFGSLELFRISSFDFEFWLGIG
ncbi:MAG: hypothetical protein HY695_00605 [Deltaproteobacteria bacterium]|nr:hypothetical protein [Deltaproteobacteria bacterium]